MPNSIDLVNENSYLIPCKNGILNTKTKQLLPHDPKFFNTYIIPIDYNEKSSITGTKFEDFLNQITNNNNLRKRILRATLYLIFTNNLTKEVGLFMYGQAGTGKSTLLNILQFLFTKEGYLSTNLSELNSNFGKVALVDKKLLILEDEEFYKGKEPRVIKKIITQNDIDAEQKFQPKFTFKPTCFVILTANEL